MPVLKKRQLKMPTARQDLTHRVNEPGNCATDVVFFPNQADFSCIWHQSVSDVEKMLSALKD